MRNQLEVWNYPSVTDYKSALSAWESAPKIRGSESERRLVPRHYDKGIIRNKDGSIGFHLHQNVAVTWSTDNTVLIRPYANSRSCTQFANAFLPSDLKAEFFGADAPYVSSFCLVNAEPRHWRLVKPTRFERVRNAWKPIDMCEPWLVPEIDRRSARWALSQAGYDDFVAWAKATIALGGWERVNGMSDPRLTVAQTMMSPHTLGGREAILAAFKNQERWMELLTSGSLTGYTYDAKTALNKVIEALRVCIYRDAGVLRVRKEPYLDGSNAPAKLAATSRKYSLSMVK